MEYIIKSGGVETENDYPFEDRNGKCRFDAKKVVAKIDSYVVLPKHKEQIMAYLVKSGSSFSAICQFFSL